jgi:hypothetical protein
MVVCVNDKGGLLVVVVVNECYKNKYKGMIIYNK